MITNQVKENVSEKEFKAFENKNLLLPAIKDLYLFTVNHKTAPVAVREKFAIPEYRLIEANQNLKNYKTLRSFIILSTCNRTEIYFTSNDFEKSLNEISNFFKQFLGLEIKVAKEYSALLKENEVAEHAFKLASGLDSLVLGETQILSQVKFAYSTAQKEKTLDKTLELLFQSIIKTAKVVHQQTNLSKNSQSISSAAIDLANNISGPIKTKSIMVLGAGKMAQLALDHILKIGGSKETVVLNKSPHRVIEFSEKYKIDRSFPFEDIYNVLNDVDILICAAGAPHFIIFAEQFKQSRKDQSKELFVFDVSMPRNVDSEFGKLPNIKLYDIDSLQTAYSKTIHANNEDLIQAEQIILNGTKTLYEQIANQDLDLLIKDLKEKVESVKKDKLTKLTSGKATFTREEVDYIVNNLTNTMLHLPIKTLKESHLPGSQEDKIQLIRDLFGL